MQMDVLRRFLPFLLTLGGVISDHVTTNIGLGLGFYEINPNYHPLLALLVFWGITAILVLLLPRERPWRISINTLMLTSYLGAVNNTLVILGVFPGLVI
jgi:hypothetical protein